MPHVLLIEDDARIREIVERGLGSRGFVVTSAEDGRSTSRRSSKSPGVELAAAVLKSPNGSAAAGSQISGTL